MAGPLRRTDPSVGERLDNEPWRFGFVQALRLLEARARRRAGARGRSHADEEPPVRLRAADTLSHPASEVLGAERDETGAVAGLVVSMFGLTGSAGVLPQRYTETLHESRRKRLPAFRDFLDIFNHRLLTLFARAAAKYRLDLSYERTPAGATDPITGVLQALVGVRGVALPGEGALDAATLVHYAGHLSQRRSSAAALAAILADDLGVPVRIEPFRTAWLPVATGEQTRLGAAFCTLGADLLVGERAQEVQGRFRIVVGPLDHGTFQEFLPDGPRMARLVALTRFQVGLDLGFDVELQLKRDSVPRSELTRGGPADPRLGWTCWLGEWSSPQDARDAVFDADRLSNR